MTAIDRLLEGDLAAASAVAAGVVPDVVAALDRLVPLLGAGGNRSALRRYYVAVDSAAQTLTAMPVNDPGVEVSPTVVYRLLRRNIPDLVSVAPTSDGLGVLTALVDRLRGLVGGLPQQCVRARRDIDDDRLLWYLEQMADLEFEQRSGSPLRRAMETLDLSSTDMAGLMGVTRQAVDKWLLRGPPAERIAKIGAIAGIAGILRYRLREGMPAVVARRSADAYGARTMLEVIAADEHEWLYHSVRDSFDFAHVA